MLRGLLSSSKEEQQKDFQMWQNELQKVEERRLEVREAKRMGEEDAHSRSWQALDKIYQPVPSPLLALTGQSFLPIEL